MSPDFPLITKHPETGRLRGRRLIMHNGLRVLPTAYYGYQFLARARLTQTVDEPQEERLFSDLLKQIEPGSMMLELGSFWAFYSLWFHAIVPNARNFMIEPVRKNMEYGQTNFEINGFHSDAVFTHGFISDKPGSIDGVQAYSVDEFCEENGIEKLAILHSDIQGFEGKMLDGARKTLGEHRVQYVFISTHSNELHTECIGKLIDYGYHIVSEANLDEAYQADGVIFAALPTLPPQSIKPASKRDSQLTPR